MPTGEFDLVASIYVAEKTQTETIFSRGIREAVYSETGWRAVECITHPGIRLVVVHRAPVIGFLVGHRSVGCVINCYVIKSVCNENRGKNWLVKQFEYTITTFEIK